MDYRKIFNDGVEFFQKLENRKARNCFTISLNQPNFKNKSIYYLTKLDFKEGKYADARKRLEENIDDKILDFKILYGMLENIENNFETSKNYFNQCLTSPKYQYKSLFCIAKLYIQTGDYDIARTILETLKLNEQYKTQTIINLICLNIFEHNYSKAYDLLNTLDKNNLSAKLLEHYKIMKNYLLYFLGNIDKIDKNLNIIRRLMFDDDKYILNHIKKHKNPQERFTNGCFFKTVELDQILNEAKIKIENMNANHFELTDMYRFSFDYPIGYKGNDETCDICVTTLLNTKKILTMFPVKLSSEFDKEQMSYSKELQLKRRGIK